MKLLENFKLKAYSSILSFCWNPKNNMEHKIFNFIQKITNYLIKEPCGTLYRPKGSAEPVSWVASAEWSQFSWFLYKQPHKM